MNLFVNPAIPFVNLAMSPPSNSQSQTKLREFGDEDYKRYFAEKSRKLLLLVFGNTWCQPCLAMEPDLARLAATWKNKVEIFKVTLSIGAQEALSTDHIRKASPGDHFKETPLADLLIAASLTDHLFRSYFENYPDDFTMPSAILIRGGAVLGRYESGRLKTTDIHLKSIKKLLAPYVKGIR